MRISSFQIHHQASQQLQALSNQTAATQQQISQGKRLVVPADDPVGAARLVEIRAAIDNREQYIDNAANVDRSLKLEESLLGQTTELLHRIQELTIQAGSGIQTAEDRFLIASEIEARFNELMALANAQDADGNYVFAGFKTGTLPFVAQGSEIFYRGDEGERKVEVERGQLISSGDAGSAVFMDIPSSRARLDLNVDPDVDVTASDFNVVDQAALDALFPDKLVIVFNDPALAGGQNNFSVRRASDQRPVDGLENVPYVSGASIQASGVSFRLSGSPQAGEQVVLGTSKTQSIFATVRDVADGLRDINAVEQPEAFQTMIDNTLEGLRNANETLSRVRADVGARFNSLTAAQDLHEDIGLQLESIRSEIEDLDFAEAVSDLAYQSFILEAAQQSYIRINNLSLFNRL